MQVAKHIAQWKKNYTIPAMIRQFSTAFNCLFLKKKDLRKSEKSEGNVSRMKQFNFKIHALGKD